MKLYNFPASTGSQKVRLCLFEKGLDFAGTIFLFAKGEKFNLADCAIAPSLDRMQDLGFGQYMER